MVKSWPVGLLMIAWAGAYSEASLAQGHDEACLNAVSDLCGEDSVRSCFSREALWDYVPQACVGEIQTMIEMEREFETEQSGAAAGTILGFSYGGILRAGPGMEFGKVASLSEGDEIEIIEDPEVWFDGYKWFRVSSPAGDGYHWGGIFCTEGGAAVEGVLSSCN